MLVSTGHKSQLRVLQWQYLTVYFIVMLADWLQGTNMYTLYAVLYLWSSHFYFGFKPFFFSRITLISALCFWSVKLLLSFFGYFIFRDQISLSFYLLGFLSSAVFGTFIGIFVDKWGRRFGCIIYCILEVVLNFLVFKRK